MPNKSAHLKANPLFHCHMQILEKRANHIPWAYHMAWLLGRMRWRGEKRDFQWLILQTLAPNMGCQGNIMISTCWHHTLLVFVEILVDVWKGRSGTSYMKMQWESKR
eukprot:5071333-Amphidinium_carterae.2